jgi:hypothetical protein
MLRILAWDMDYTLFIFIFRAPTGKPIGSEDITKFEPTSLPVGATFQDGKINQLFYKYQ